VPEPSDIQCTLRRLHDDYVEQINMLVAEGREDLVQRLVDAYEDEALRLILVTPT
jgi:hypothetical protein